MYRKVIFYSHISSDIQTLWTIFLYQILSFVQVITSTELAFRKYTYHGQKYYTICIYPSTIMWVFLFYERADQNTSRSLYDECFGWRASKIKTSTQQRVQTERRVIITGLFKSVLVFFLTKTDEESPVIITSLSVWYELWLDSREEIYTLYSSSRVVHVSSNLSTIMLTYYIKVVYFYLLILISYLSIVFCDCCIHVDTIRISPGVSPLGVSVSVSNYNDTPCRCAREEWRVTVKCSRYNE